MCEARVKTHLFRPLEAPLPPLVGEEVGRDDLQPRPIHKPAGNTRPQKDPQGSAEGAVSEVLLPRVWHPECGWGRKRPRMPPGPGLSHHLGLLRCLRQARQLPLQIIQLQVKEA